MGLNVEALTDERLIFGDASPSKEFLNDIEDFLHMKHLKPIHDKALFILLMDVSGSMGLWEKYIIRCAWFWTKRMLFHKYGSVECKFIAYHTESHFAMETHVFNKGQSGGTISSSPIRKTLEHLDEFDYSDHDIYVIQGTDGDNLTADNDRYFRFCKELISMSRSFTYLEVNQYSRFSTLGNAMERYKIDYINRCVIKQRGGVADALRTIFHPLTAPNITNLGHVHRLRKDE